MSSRIKALVVSNGLNTFFLHLFSYGWRSTHAIVYKWRRSEDDIRDLVLSYHVGPTVSTETFRQFRRMVL